jgi:hypothetical protein
VINSLLKRNNYCIKAPPFFKKPIGNLPIKPVSIEMEWKERRSKRSRACALYKSKTLNADSVSHSDIICSLGVKSAKTTLFLFLFLSFSKSSLQFTFDDHPITKPLYSSAHHSRTTMFCLQQIHISGLDFGGQQQQ